MKTKVAIFIGTRPEAVKMAPICLEMSRSRGLSPLLVDCGQHRDLVRPALDDFGLKPDFSLGVMDSAQSLAGLSARLFTAVDELLVREKPSAVLVQGDTTTVLVAAQSSFYRQIPVGHVEAGLRSGDLRNPFPEEMNRRAVGLVSQWHFAPTARARQNLLAEGVAEDMVLVTGNPVIDALKFTRSRLDEQPPALPARLAALLAEKRSLVLVTSHRRENFGSPLDRICAALLELTELHPEVRFVWPVHPNPRVRETTRRFLEGRPGIVLEEPLAYRAFVRLMLASRLLLTDSGGLQEEGPALGRPVLVMRQVTERPEGIEAGVNRLVGLESGDIVRAVSEGLANRVEDRLIEANNPYGDGRAAERIVAFLEARLGSEVN